MEGWTDVRTTACVRRTLILQSVRYSQYSEIQLEVCPFCEIQLLTVTVISRTARLTAAGRHVFDVCAIRRRRLVANNFRAKQEPRGRQRTEFTRPKTNTRLYRYLLVGTVLVRQLTIMY
jgi:hypothetical protein